MEERRKTQEQGTGLFISRLTLFRTRFDHWTNPVGDLYSLMVGN